MIYLFETKYRLRWHKDGHEVIAGKFAVQAQGMVTAYPRAMRAAIRKCADYHGRNTQPDYITVTLLDTFKELS